jgi:creatinine deaminase
MGGEKYLQERGVEVVVLDNAECKQLMEQFIASNPTEW